MSTWHVEYAGPDGNNYSEDVTADTVHQATTVGEHSTHSAVEIIAAIQVSPHSREDQAHLAHQKLFEASMFLFRYDYPEVGVIRAKIQALMTEVEEFINTQNPVAAMSLKDRWALVQAEPVVATGHIDDNTKRQFQILVLRERLARERRWNYTDQHPDYVQRHKIWNRRRDDLREFVLNHHVKTGVMITIPESQAP